MSNSLDPVQDRHYVDPDLDPNCLQTAKHGIGADLIFFHVISMLQKNCVIKDHFIIVMQKGIVRSCLPENFKQLTLPVLEILSNVPPKCPNNSYFLFKY